jgi:RNA recognition motif-containing protein
VTTTCRFGFITFEDIRTAERILEKYDGSDLDGFQISLKFAEERKSGGGGRSSDWGRGGGRDRG